MLDKILEKSSNEVLINDSCSLSTKEKYDNVIQGSRNNVVKFDTNGLPTRTRNSRDDTIFLSDEDQVLVEGNISARVAPTQKNPMANEQPKFD